MRKIIFLFSSLFIFFFLFPFWNNKIYAQTSCQLSAEPTTFPPTFKGSITINGNGCFNSAATYTILGYPAYISPDKYFSYSVDQRQTLDPNSITAQFDLTQPNREKQSQYIFSGIGEDNPGPWVIKVCVAESIADCGNKDNTVGNVIPITVGIVPTPTPTPIPTNLPKVYIIPTQCTFKIGSEVKVTVDNVQPKTDYQWWWKEGLLPTSHTLRPEGSDTFIKFSVPGNETAVPKTRILCVDISGLKRCGFGSRNSAELKFTIEPPPLDSSQCIETATGGQVAQDIPTPTPIAPPPPCSQWTDLSGTPIPTESPNIQNADYPKKCAKVATGLGIPISTDPGALVKSVFGVILSISGGIALILIMISGYRLIFSQGNPEEVKGAQEQLTSAIVGLLFIIFSLVILQIIGANILQIPGFTK